MSCVTLACLPACCAALRCAVPCRVTNTQQQKKNKKRKRSDHTDCNNAFDVVLLVAAAASSAQQHQTTQRCVVQNQLCRLLDNELSQTHVRACADKNKNGTDERLRPRDHLLSPQNKNKRKQISTQARPRSTNRQKENAKKKEKGTENENENEKPRLSHARDKTPKEFSHEESERRNTPPKRSQLLAHEKDTRKGRKQARIKP